MVKPQFLKETLSDLKFKFCGSISVWVMLSIRHRASRSQKLNVEVTWSMYHERNHAEIFHVQ